MNSSPHVYGTNASTPSSGRRRGARGPFRRGLGATALLLCSLAAMAPAAQAQTSLADAPIFTTLSVPGNLVLALSVEFPTATTAIDRSAYSTATQYLGYFDPLKCYTYKYNDGANGSYFSPAGASGSGYACSGKWSGNFLNWATMQAIDPFRWALTGGYRSVDTVTTTILEKAWAPSNQGTSSLNFPFKSLTSGVANATPFSGSTFYMQVLRCGNKMLFNQKTAFTVDNCPTSGVTAWNGTVSGTSTTSTYSVDVRVAVCVPGSLEANCKAYGSNHKPEGLVQKYASQIRYSAFGYLLDPTPTGGSMLRDGGVLRARQKFVGSTQPVPGSSPIANPNAEWDPSTGVLIANPDPADAAASSESGSVIASSGVINYLNQFGRSSQAYKYYDPVSELYYAATRYLRNLGNVSEYSDLTRYNGGASTLAQRTAMKDGFPVITNWTDPILYYCQQNFVLGIGDTNTNQDKDVPGNTANRSNEPTMPSAVAADPINAVTATNKVGVLDGIGASIGNTNNYNSSSNSAYMAGLAYLFHTSDIRSDLTGTQTISTFWFDVLEGGDYKAGPAGRNQFYLTAKYGGFTVPAGYSYATNTTPLTQALWSTSGDTLPGLGARPDNYYVANQADKMVSGLNSAFATISSAVTAYTTSFSTSLPQVAISGNLSYSAQYDASHWTGEITANNLSFDPVTRAPSLVQAWTFTSLLAAQLAGSGWDTNRRIATWNGTNGVAFRTGPLSGTQLNALDTSYVSGNDSTNYLNYLRGDKTNEQASTAGGSTHAYRNRLKLLGDIVGSKPRPVGPPSFPFSDAVNPGYSAFKTTWGSRPTVVYVGSNDGMLHAIRGDLSAPPGGAELFAYVPNALFQGPNGTPNVDGLASLGNPSLTHHYMVNATPNVYDIDFARTADASGNPQTGTPNWRSVLIGGLGKGGRAYYAIDVTDPVGMSASESAVASKVLWEFTNTDLGYTYGDPVVVKTKKYGWVVIFASGYNNTDNQGHFLIVNPRTGALLEKVSTGAGTSGASAGLATLNAFVVDGSDGTADAVYAGDLLGNLWRWDVTATSGLYPAPVKFAVLTDSSGIVQPVTTRPVIEVHPSLYKRFVMVGTGRLLDANDMTSTQGQTFYAISDGTNARFNAASDLPAGISFPIPRSKLAANTNSLVGVTFNPNTQMGWYEDLGTGTGGIGWRVTSDLTTLVGTVAFAATLPNGSVCSPAGDSRVYGRDFGTATTTAETASGGTLVATPFVAISGSVTDLRFLSVNGYATLVAGTDAGSLQKIATNAQPGLIVRRLNWRELQMVD